MASSRPPGQQRPRETHEIGQRADGAGDDGVVARLGLVGLGTCLDDVDVRKRQRVADGLEKATLLPGRLDQREAAAGSTIASGIPGNPAPLPTSAMRSPLSHGRTVSESSTCFVICCSRSRIAVRLKLRVPLVDQIEVREQRTLLRSVQLDAEFARA